MARLRSVLGAGAAIPSSEWRFFRSRLAPHRLAPRQLLLRQGERSDRVWFVAAGLLRIFRTEGTRQVTLGFDLEDRFVGAYDSVLSGEPASFSIEALEPCELWSFDRATLQRLYQRHRCWERVGRLQAERQLLRRTHKEVAIRSLRPAARYRQLVAQQSWILQRVPQYHVASYLGVSPETLSRIRARLPGT
jgi:CRP-like cAMP-binding protein